MARKKKVGDSGLPDPVPEISENVPDSSSSSSSSASSGRAKAKTKTKTAKKKTNSRSSRSSSLPDSPVHTGTGDAETPPQPAPGDSGSPDDDSVNFDPADPENAAEISADEDESGSSPEEKQQIDGENEIEDSDDEPDENSGESVSALMQTSDADSPLRNMMNRNFIEYASYVIKDRAIPDVDDGLKPVQRRILWTLFEKDDGTFHKVANIIGETMKYHPHGDASIGDALVNLANKEIYIDRQGNFGNIMTGSPSAAPRYIECRLTPLAREVLFNRDITELIDSYDGRNREPVCLPSKLPTLLLMGADGIAVGTKTSIMPHNFTELLQAQIAILKGESFTLYPDFLQGGIMDVSKYEDGMGKLVVRARLEVDGRNLSIREIPPVTNTAKLMDSIEGAVNKNKIKIASFKDYTAASVDIQLTPLRGYDPLKAKKALYAYTDCQMNISCNPMVILENRPVRMPVSDILRRNTEKLLQYLKWELQLEAGKCLSRILARTLAQIFIEEGIYKRIEKCRTSEAIFKEVRSGLEKFRSEWLPLVRQLHENQQDLPRVTPLEKEEEARLEQLAEGIIPDAEISRLVEIPIRRISAFEIGKNREEIELLRKTLQTALRNLKRIKAYAIGYLEKLIEKYGPLFPRRTEVRLDGFEKIDKSAVALNNIRVGWDKKNCYIGTNVKSDDTVLCNEFDHLLCIERTGEYKIIDIPEKIFIDRLYEFRKYDKSTVFGIIYSEKKTGRAYFKRSSIDAFIKDKEYRLIPESCRLDLITPRPNALYEIKVDTPIKAKQIQTVNLMDAPLRSPKAGGSPLSPRKILKITFMQYLDGTEELEEEQPSLLELPPQDPSPSSPSLSLSPSVSASLPASGGEASDSSPSARKESSLSSSSGVAGKKVPAPPIAAASGSSPFSSSSSSAPHTAKSAPNAGKTAAQSGKKGKAPSSETASGSSEQLPAANNENGKKKTGRTDSSSSGASGKERKQPAPSSPSSSAPASSSISPDEEENWGIQQPDLGF